MLAALNWSRVLPLVGALIVIVIVCVFYGSFLESCRNGRADARIEKHAANANAGLSKADDARDQSLQTNGSLTRAENQLDTESEKLNEAQNVTDDAVRDADAVRRSRNYTNRNGAAASRKLDRLYPD